MLSTLSSVLSNSANAAYSSFAPSSSSFSSFSALLKSRIYGNYIDESLYLPTFHIDTFIYSQPAQTAGSSDGPVEKVSLTIFPKRKSFRGDLTKYEQAFIDYMIELYQDNKVNLLSIMAMRLIEMLTVDSPSEMNVRKEHFDFLQSSEAPERLKFFFSKPPKASMLNSFKQRYSVLILNDKKVFQIIASNRILYN